MDSLPVASVLYDVGCGNGKYLVTKDKLIKVTKYILDCWTYVMNVNTGL